jgi:hypothetical protein
MRARKMKLHGARTRITELAHNKGQRLYERCPLSFKAVKQLSCPFALGQHRCLAHLPQHSVEFASFDSCDDSLD